MRRNKLLSLLMSVLIMFFLAACNPGEELDIDALLVEAQEQVTLAGTVSSNITLPTTVVVDELTVAVSWSSSNTAVISNTGVVTRPSAATGNVSVTLTATFSYEGEEKVGTFVVIVEALAQVTFTITFNSNDGSAVASITANQGSTITAPTPPTKLNHTFGGWYKEVALTTQWNFTTDQVNANTTLYAKWVENDSYDVTFYKGNGEPDVVVSVYAGQKVTAITNPIALGYEFSFWMKADFEPWNFEVDVVTDDITLYAFYDIITYTVTYVLPTGAEHTGTPGTAFDIITPITDLGSAYLANHEFLGWFTAETGGTKVTSVAVGTTGNLTLYAQFEEDEQFTVTFNDMMGGITTETLYYGYVTEPTDPIRSGYLFLGWFKDMDGLVEYDFEFDIVSADITLYAIWEKLVPEGMTGVYTAEEFYQMTLHTGTDSFFLMNDIDFSTYTWVAHNNSFKGIFDGDYNVISHLTIESTNAANYGGIFPRANGATIKNLLIEDLHIDVVNRAGGLIGRVENGKVNVQDLSITRAHVMGTANEGVALLIGQAAFEVEIHNVSISASKAFTTQKYASLFIGRSDVVVNASDIFIRDSVAEITATNTDSGASGIVSYTNADAAHVTVNRLFILNSYLHGKYAGAVSGYQNRGTVTINNAFIEITFTYMDAPNSGLVSRVNTTGVAPTFTNLFVDLKFETPTHAQVVASLSPQQQDLQALDLLFWMDHLNAIASSSLWVSAGLYYVLENDHGGMVDTFTVTFNVDGGTAIESYTLISGSKAFIPSTTTKLEHIFDGFYKDAMFATLFDFNTELVTENTTIYVKWIEMDKFDVTFNTNGGTSVNPLLNVLDGSLINEPTAPTRLGYTFAGWFKDEAFTTSFVFASDLILADTTLYAKWEVVEYTITYHMNGGETASPTTYTIETPTITLLEAMKLGYSFTAWTNAAVDGAIVTEVSLGTTGNLNFYAQYNTVLYTIDYMLDGGTLDAPNPETYLITSTTLVLNGASKEGYEFAGWFDAESEGTLYTQISSGSTGNITLYARFYLLVIINFYGEEPVNIIDLQANSWYPSTIFALTDQNELFAKGGNDAGLLANGTNVGSNQWIQITGFFELLENEVILSVQLNDAMAVAHTSEDRIFVWGYFNTDEGMDIYSNEPIDVTSLFDFTLGTPDAYYNYGRFFIVQTTDGRLQVYTNMTVHDITPTLGVGESLDWSQNFGFGSNPYSSVIFTGTRFLMVNPYDLSELYDMTTTLNLPAENILAILAQEFSVHVLTETKYTFATFTGDEMNPTMALSIDLTIDLNPSETLVTPFGGGGFITSEGRVLIPMYILEDEESEMPVLVVYHDITSEFMLEVGETIVGSFEPFFIHTSFGRLLLVLLDENFVIDPMATPDVSVIDLGLEAILDESEVFLSVLFVGYEVYLQTTAGIYLLVFGQETLVLEKIEITTLGVVYSDIYSVNNLDLLYEPMDRMYEDFVGWYLDPELMNPFDPEEVFDGIYLYPKWVKTHYFIEFQLYGYMEIEVIATEFGQIPIAPNDPIYDHMIFTGWYYYDQMSNYQSYDFSYAIDFDVTLFAQTQNKQYNVTFQFETEDPIVTQAYAYTNYGDLYIQVPEGYEIVAIYLDEDMLIPFDPDLQVLSDITLYVAIDFMTIDVYYYQDMEEVSFSYIFTNDLSTFGFSTDGRIFAWGSNFNGGLGIGFDHIYTIQTPLDITALFNLEMGEEITQTYAYFSYKVFITSEGRVFAWGYPDSNYDYVGTPQDITALFNFQMGEEITDVKFLYNTVYIFTDLGNVYIYQSYNNDFVHQFSTTLSFTDVFYVEQYDYLYSDIVVILPEGAFRLASTVHGDAAVVTEINNAFDDEVFKMITNFQAYNEFFVYTKEGRVYLYNHNNKTLTLIFDLSLNEFDYLVEVFEMSWDLKLYYTADGRLYKHLGEGVTSEFDLSLLVMGEKLIYNLFSAGFYTNLGNFAYINTDLMEVTSVELAFALDTETIVYLKTIDYVVYAYTTNEMYIAQGDPAMEFVVYVGIDLVVEQFTYGDLFEFLTPAPKMGYDFNGWLDDDQYPYSDTPINDIILYAGWSPIPE